MRTLSETESPAPAHTQTYVCLYMCAYVCVCSYKCFNIQTLKANKLMSFIIKKDIDNYVKTFNT